MSKKHSRLIKPVVIIAFLAILVYLISCTIKYISFTGGNVSEEQLRLFLEKRGWQTGALVEERTIVIPESFSAVYERYNELQKESGFDLRNYRSLTVRQTVFEIKNATAPDGQPLSGAYAHVLSYGNRVIGGDISSSSLRGFMCGL